MNDLATPSGQSTALTVQQRAVVALNTEARSKELRELVTQSAGIVEITNPAGRDECHRARMVLKAARLDDEKRGEAARKDAREFAAAVIAAANGLLAITADEEDRLHSLQRGYETKIAEEKQRKEAAERARITAIAERIAEIKRRPIEALRLDSAGVIAALFKLETDCGPTASLTWAAEFGDEANAAYEASRDYMIELRDKKLAGEFEDKMRAAEKAEQKRKDEEAATERKRLDDVAQEQRAEQDRIAAERRQKEDAELAASRARDAEINRNWSQLNAFIAEALPGTDETQMQRDINVLLEFDLSEAVMGDRSAAAVVVRGAGVERLRAILRGLAAARQLKAADEMRNILTDVLSANGPVEDLEKFIEDLVATEYTEHNVGDHLQMLTEYRAETVAALRARAEAMREDALRAENARQADAALLDTATLELRAMVDSDPRISKFVELAAKYRATDGELPSLQALIAIIRLYEAAIKRPQPRRTKS